MSVLKYLPHLARLAGVKKAPTRRSARGACRHGGSSFRYVDINVAGLTKDDLAAKPGKPVTTVPQIFLDEQHIGGCTDFEAYAREIGRASCRERV